MTLGWMNKSGKFRFNATHMKKVPSQTVKV
jgi:hypothetical protein